MDGKQGWVPASFLEPNDQILQLDHNEELEPSKVTDGEKYLTTAPFRAQNEMDISLPQSASVEVIEKSITGWWTVRYTNCVQLFNAWHNFVAFMQNIVDRVYYLTLCMC